jgi:hypothetical protein
MPVVRKHPAERFETIAATAKRQPNHIVPLVFIRQAALKLDVARRVSHTAESFKSRATPARVWIVVSIPRTSNFTRISFRV